jgi:hypothetical protein
LNTNGPNTWTRREMTSFFIFLVFLLLDPSSNC